MLTKLRYIDSLKHAYTDDFTYLINKFKYFYMTLKDYNEPEPIKSEENKENKENKNELVMIECPNCPNTFIWVDYNCENIYCWSCNQKVKRKTN